MSKIAAPHVVQSAPSPTIANSAEDYCSAVAAAVAVVANQAVAVLVAAGAVSSTAVHFGLAAGRIAALQSQVLRYTPDSPAPAVAGIPEE